MAFNINNREHRKRCAKAGESAMQIFIGGLVGADMLRASRDEKFITGLKAAWRRAWMGEQDKIEKEGVDNDK
jgi:hypothetical protein